MALSFRAVVREIIKPNYTVISLILFTLSNIRLTINHFYCMLTHYTLIAFIIPLKF